LKYQNERKVSSIWNEASAEWADFVRSGKDYWRDFVNNPTAFKMIGKLKGKIVLDLACGEGYNTRILARKGAVVTGIDASEELLDMAIAEERRNRLGITYHRMSASHLKSLKDDSFDLVTCFMALHDIANYRGAVAEVSGVLKQGGRFVFSMPHPCFEDMEIDGMKVNAAERYFDRIRYPLRWNMQRLTKPFVTVSFHRSLTDYSRALAKNHLLIVRIIEPQPTKKVMQKLPKFRDQNRSQKPWSIIFETIKQRK
jgi:ubiquinone/menaquinone biosynthesis C-methylase UbiE